MAEDPPEFLEPCPPKLSDTTEAQAAAEPWTHHEVLTRLLAEDVAHRAGTRITRKSHQTAWSLAGC
jgi:hypothetical protein